MKQAKKGSKGSFYAIVAAITLVGVALLFWLANRRGGAVATLDPNLPPVKAEGYTLGNPNAPVEIIEFADFECPGCGQWAMLQEPDVRQRLINTGQARFRFLDFQVNNSHRNTITASLAAGCAADQGKFWEMHDLIFQTQDRWSTAYTNNPRAVMDDLAKQLGLDMATFGPCMDSKKHQAKIAANAAEATRVGVNSTPSIVIGGKVYPGPRFDEIKAAVEETAKKSGAAPAAVAPTAGATTGATSAATPKK